MEGEGLKGKGQRSRVFTQRHVKVKSSRSHSWPRPASGLTSERGRCEGRKGKGRGTEPHLIDVSLVKCSNSLAVTPPCDNATCDYSARVQLLCTIEWMLTEWVCVSVYWFLFVFAPLARAVLLPCAATEFSHELQQQSPTSSPSRLLHFHFCRVFSHLWWPPSN